MFCTNCGNEIKEEGNFCPKCGHKLGETIQKEKNDEKRPINIKFSYCVVAIIVLLIIGFVISSYIGGSNGLVNSTSRAKNESTENLAYQNNNQPNTTSKSGKVSIGDKNTYITNNPIPEQMEMYPSDLTSDKYLNTYNTVDILVLAGAKNYAEKNLNIQKITKITLCQRDSYGRYRIMIVYYTPTSKITDFCVVYAYYNKDTGGASFFFETNKILPNTSEWNTPLSFD